ncbi:MAG: hypothetical protein HYX48_03685 [Chlamydiales bacterium]|nr:hypothetical protein [Chlamydiales bacterium]
MSSTLALTAASRPHPMHDVDGVLPHILSYCQEKSHSLVNHAFRDSNNQAMIDVGLRILMRGSDYEAEVERESRRFINAGESVQEAASRHREEFRGHVHINTGRLQVYFSLSERMMFFELFISQSEILICHAELNEGFRMLCQMPAGEIADAALLKRREALKSELREKGERFASEISLRSRAEQVFLMGLNLTAASLRELHLSQRNRLSLHPDSFAEFAEHTNADENKNSFSLARFRQTETLCRDFEDKEGDNFNSFWNQLRERHPEIFPAEIAASRRRWLNAPENAERLQQITILVLMNLWMIPPEIGKFTNLKGLCVRALDGVGLRTLPDELRGLNLSSLMIRGSNFSRIPDLLAEISAGVVITGNKSRAILPEAVALKHCSGITSHLTDYFDEAYDAGFNGGFYGDPEPGAPHLLGMRREEIAEMPFFLWFRDTFSIPYCPYVMYVGGVIGRALLGFADEVGHRLNLHEWVKIALILVLMTPLLFIVFPLATLRSIPCTMLTVCCRTS